MSTSLTIGSVMAKLSWTFSQTQNWGDSTSQSSAFSFSDSLANGTGADQADRLYVNKTTIAAGGTTNLDLAGSLTDVFGGTITFVKVKLFYFELTTDTTASSVSIGGAGSNPAPLWWGDTSDIVKVLNGGFFMVYSPNATGYAVTAGTGDILKLLNNDGSNVATYKIAVVGTSA